MVHDNKDLNVASPTKKEKAAETGKDIMEVSAKALGRVYGGPVGGAVVDYALNTKLGQKAISTVANREANKNFVVRSVLAKNQSRINGIKPMANSLVNSIGGFNNGNDTGVNNANNKIGSSLFNKSHSNIHDDSSDNTLLEGKGKAPLTLKLLFRKNKFAFIGIGAGIFLCIVFMMVIMVPVMSVLGLFGDENSSEIITGTNNALSGGYTEVSKNISYWFPVGSSETTTIGGVTYASGEPMSTNITSSFGNQEAFRTSKHGGIDIGNGGNGPGVVNIIAAKDGVVTYPSDTSQTAYDDNGYYGNYADGGGFGNYVMIKHNDGTVTVYAHLAQNSITVFSGDTVRQGQVIGKMGHSGSSTGTHLHFEVRVNGTRVYPLNYISASNTRP